MARMMQVPQISFINKPLCAGLPCGDAWFSYFKMPITRFMHADGLGHGETAHQAVTLLQKQMLWLCERSITLASLEVCFDNLHGQLSKLDQGYQAAVAIVDINIDSGVISALSIGNVEIHCFNEQESFCFPNRYGMVGGRLPSRCRASTYLPTLPALLASWSDGIDRIAAHSYIKKLVDTRSFLRLDALFVAQKMMRDFAIASDDASCSVAILRGK
jgi:hypothetical protein